MSADDAARTKTTINHNGDEGEKKEMRDDNDDGDGDGDDDDDRGGVGCCRVDAMHSQTATAMTAQQQL